MINNLIRIVLVFFVCYAPLFFVIFQKDYSIISDMIKDDLVFFIIKYFLFSIFYINWQIYKLYIKYPDLDQYTPGRPAFLIVVIFIIFYITNLSAALERPYSIIQFVNLGLIFAFISVSIVFYTYCRMEYLAFKHF